MKNKQSIDDIIYRLIDILKQEKTLLLSGAYPQLPPITEKKKALMAYLEGFLQQPDASEFISIHKRNLLAINAHASANQKLLESATEGVKSAQNRINSMAQEEAKVGTYTEYGDKLHLQEAVATRKKIA